MTHAGNQDYAPTLPPLRGSDGCVCRRREKERKGPSTSVGLLSLSTHGDDHDAPLHGVGQAFSSILILDSNSPYFLLLPPPDARVLCHDYDLMV